MRPTFRQFSLPPVIQLSNASFQRADGQKLFQNLNFQLPSYTSGPQALAVLGSTAEERYTFLQVLRGEYQSNPPASRSYPFLSTIEAKDSRLRSPHHAVQYVGFDAERGPSFLRGAYISARYESRREVTDSTLRSYLLNTTQLNTDQDLLYHPDEAKFQGVMKDLYLERLLDLPVSNLSNGQTRRAQIAKSLLQNPKVILMNNPFMGLDPNALNRLSEVLENLSRAQFPRLVLALNTNELLPSWISDLVFLSRGYKIESQGSKFEVTETLQKRFESLISQKEVASQDDVTFLEDASRFFIVSRQNTITSRWARDKIYDDYLKSWNAESRWNQETQMDQKAVDGTSRHHGESKVLGETVVEMAGVKVSYGERPVVGGWTQDYEGEKRDGLWWKIRQGERWGMFGANGSGKTTLTAIITSDHPQAYSLPVKLFGKSRLAAPGQPAVSLFDLQSRIGLCSPELHAFFPKRLTIRQILESAWAETPLSPVVLTSEIDERVNAFLHWFQGELCPDLGHSKLTQEDRFNYSTDIHDSRFAREQSLQAYRENYYSHEYLEWADTRRFGELAFPSQRLLLFLRAIIKSPDLVVLDEPFSGLDSETVRKCHAWLAHGEQSVFTFQTRANGPKAKAVVHSSSIDTLNLLNFKGLTSEQALLFICHREEEVPGVIREWIRLPDPDVGGLPSFGRFVGPLQENPNRWREVWGLPLYETSSLFPNLDSEANSLKSQTSKRRYWSTPFPDAESMWNVSNEFLIKECAKRQIWNLDSPFHDDNLKGSSDLGSLDQSLRVEDSKNSEKTAKFADLEPDSTTYEPHTVEELLKRSTRALNNSRAMLRYLQNSFDRIRYQKRLPLLINVDEIYDKYLEASRLSGRYAVEARTLMLFIRSRLLVLQTAVFQSSGELKKLENRFNRLRQRVSTARSRASILVQDAEKLRDAVQYRLYTIMRIMEKVTGKRFRLDLRRGKGHRFRTIPKIIQNLENPSSIDILEKELAFRQHIRTHVRKTVLFLEKLTGQSHRADEKWTRKNPIRRKHAKIG